MTLHPHWGHQELLEALARARTEETLPAALLLHGSRGVGKQHLALWLARLILCEKPSPSGPCEACHPCALAGKIEHPDLHWYFPLPRPKNASTPEKLGRALEEARAEVLTAWRAEPLQPSGDDQAKSLYLAAARALRKKAHRRPSMGSHQVFIIAEAESLAPQESSSEAANALLKLLEEPPDGTVLILTSAEPGRLLPTIRSRTTQVHLPPLTKAEVETFLIGHGGMDPEEAGRVAELSRGSIGRGLGFRRDGEDPGPLEQTRSDALRLLAAALAPSSDQRLKASLMFKPVGARGLRDLFNFLEESLGELARASSGLAVAGASPKEAAYFEKTVRRLGIRPAAVPVAIRHVDEARLLAAGNVNPQLVVFGLLHDLREALIPGTEKA